MKESRPPHGRHLATAFCCREYERKRLRLAEEEAQEGTERDITDYGIPPRIWSSTSSNLGDSSQKAHNECPCSGTQPSGRGTGRSGGTVILGVPSREGADSPGPRGRILRGGVGFRWSLSTVLKTWDHDTAHWEGFVGIFYHRGGPTG